MKKVTVLSIFLLVSLLVTAGCLGPKEIEEKNDPEDEPPTVFTASDLVNSTNEFSFEMYNMMATDPKNQDDNIFFSPYSITIALGMINEGASGETEKEIRNVINLPENDTLRKNLIYSLQSQLNPGNTNYDLSTANAFWMKKGADLKDEFQNILQNYYLATGQELDFGRDPDGSADTINTWVENETNGKIKELIKPNMLDSLTFLVLTNAIYFKANWTYQFSKDATKDLDFHLSDGNTVKVPTMRMNDRDIDLKYTSNNDVQMLELPYKDNELAMYIILPKNNSISDIEPDINGQYLDDLKTNMREEWMDVYLPRFKFDEEYDLVNYLYDLGMEKAFSPTEADFSGVADFGGENLYISFVVQKSFIDVNEEGTEAAAATAVGMTLTSVQPTPIRFIADHPFLFLIEHKETGQILFMGKVEDPSA